MSREARSAGPRRTARPRRQQHPPEEPVRRAPTGSDESALSYLELHRIELEAQNEELRRAKISLRASRDALAESEQRYRELFEAAPVGYLTVGLDGRIESANAAALTLLGDYPLEGRRFSDFVAPERQDLWHRHRRALLRGEARPVLAIELRALEGTAIHVELASTVARSESEATGLRLALLDVTDRHQAVSAARQSARSAQIMADALPVLVAYVGTDERCRFANAAYVAWFGEATEALQGRSLSEVLGATAYGPMREQVQAALAGKAARFEGEIEYRAIGTRYVHVAYAPDLGDDGAVRGCYLVVHDLSALRRAEHALRATAAEAALAEQRERRRLAQDLHDDAGQILSLASIELRALSDAVDAHERERRITRLTTLVADAREHVASLSFQLSPPMLHDVGLVAAAQWLGDDLARSYGLLTRITVSDEPQAALDEATRVTLFRALRELLINVARHAETTHARVRMGHDGDCVAIEVADSGCGFDPNPGRLGFGLRSVRDRIEHMGGSVQIESAPGRGTTVSVRVPMNGGEAAAPAPDPNER